MTLTALEMCAWTCSAVCWTAATGPPCARPEPYQRGWRGGAARPGAGVLPELLLSPPGIAAEKPHPPLSSVAGPDSKQPPIALQKCSQSAFCSHGSAAAGGS